MLKKIGLIFGLLFLAAGGRAVEDGITSFPSCARVSVSTTAASPSTLVTTNRKAKRTQVYVNPIAADGGTPANSDAILIGNADTTFSTSVTTGTARVRAGAWWSPDAPEAPWQGTLKGVALSTGVLNVDVCQEQ